MVTFEDFLEEALYGEHGFYTRGGGAGRRSDFLTSPEVGPLFGAVLARALDAEWERLGRPERFVVVEAGAGRGTLARAVIGAGPACLDAGSYLCVERSAAARAEAEAAGLAVAAELPAEPVTGVVVANELLDNLPFALLEHGAGGWAEVGVADGSEVLVAASPADAELAQRLAPDAAAGARIPLQRAARRWLRAALGVVERGRVVVIDYGDTTASLAARPWLDWVRTYRGHGRGGHPLEAPGTQDVTCEVALDELASVRPPDTDRRQADWLRAHGLDSLVAEARDAWRAGARRGDLVALAARSRVGEAEALTDGAGLGAFRVLEWEVP